MTTDLVWKPEPEKLREKRDIICEVPELLMEILEHDYGNWVNNPEDPIEIRYYWGRHQKNAAWQHLLRRPPIIEVERDGETEFFAPVAGAEYNPYRKTHAYKKYWAWYVLRWELVPPDEVGRRRRGKSR